MTKPPKVSVLMPVFNGSRFVADAVESVLAQTFTDFELVVVDDASTDSTRSVLDDYARRDGRVKLLINEANVGVAATLNKGIQHCRGVYVARMDADDICLPERLQRQVEFLDRSPHVGVCGTWFTIIGQADAYVQPLVHPLADDEIKIHHLLGNNAICHPTAVLRRSVLAQTGLTYRPEDCPAEDLWLWIRLGFVTQVANLPEPLLLYRVHPQQVSMLERPLQHERAAAARIFFAEKILSRPLTDLEISAHDALSGKTAIATPRELRDVHEYVVRLETANASVPHIDEARLHSALAEALEKLPVRYAQNRYKYSAKYDLALLFAFFRDPLRPFHRLKLSETVRFVAKCVVRHIPAGRRR